MTASWSGPRPAPRAAELVAALPAATYWTSVVTDDSIPADEVWLHLCASASHLHGEELSRLTGTSSAARTRTGCPLTPRGCDTPAPPLGAASAWCRMIANAAWKGRFCVGEKSLTLP